MKRELYINDRLLDLNGDTTIALTFQVNDIGELQNRQANYSNQFTIPATNNNKIALGFSNVTSSDSAYPYRKTQCNYFQNGVHLIQNGVIIIDAFDGDNFNITIYSGIYDFFSQIDGLTLKSIDFSNLDHNFVNGNIRTFNRNWKDETSNICYPIINYGGTLPSELYFGAPLYVTTTGIDVRWLFPAIRYKYLIERIFDLTDYSFSGQIFQESMGTDLALTLNTGLQYDEEAVLLARSYRGGLNRTIYDGVNNVVHINLLHLHRDFTSDSSLFECTSGALIIDTGKPAVSILDYIVSGYALNGEPVIAASTVIPVSKTRYKALSYNTLSIEINMFFTKLDPLAVSNIFIYYVKNGKYFKVDKVDTPSTLNETLEYSATTSIDVKPGDIIEIFGRGRGFMIGFQDNGGGILWEKSNISITASNTIALNSLISMNAIMPETPLVDVIKTFCQMYGLIVTSQDYNLRFTKFKEITKGTQTLIDNDDSTYLLESPVYEDWSLKLDLSKPIGLQYRIGSYGQSNLMKYASDSNTNGYGDWVINVDDKTLPLESTLFQLPYSSALPYSNVLKTEEGVVIPAYELYPADEWDFEVDYTEGDIVRYGSKIYVCILDHQGSTPSAPSSIYWELRLIQYQQTISSNNCLVLIKNITPEKTWYYYNGDGVDFTSITVNNNVPVAYFTDTTKTISLNFQYLVEEYYSDIRNMLNRHKSVDCYLKLTESDINNLNFLKLKYIKFFGDFFYLNQVEEYIEGQPTKCKLIRI